LNFCSDIEVDGVLLALAGGEKLLLLTNLQHPVSPGIIKRASNGEETA